MKLRTREGHALRLTPDHLVLSVSERTRYRRETEWRKAQDLRPGDEIVLHNNADLTEWAGPHSQSEGYLIGLLLGDGTLKTDKAILGAWDPMVAKVANGETLQSHGVRTMMDAAHAAALTLPHRADFSGWLTVAGQPGHYRLALGALKTLAHELGMAPGNKTLTPEIERCSSAFYRGFLRGLFDADGSVQGAQAKGVSVRLTQVSLAVLEGTQRMLGRLGINSTIYRNRRAGGPRALPDGKGGSKEYLTQPLHELIISGANLATFATRIGFSDADKGERLKQSLNAYQRTLNRDRFVATVESLEEDGIEAVYDVTVSEVHAFDANGLYVHNCAEQPLPPYGCCCLGSIDLTKFVKNPFAENNVFDFEHFGKVVTVATRMLDNVLDVTAWPLKQQHEEAMNKRRVGLGFTGLGDALIMLRLRYDTLEARQMAAKISEAMRDHAYRASAELAREKGAFPLFN
ncbi:MAG: LAGLIDADG family homing endonuclease, partial [Burkholderiales bacterium]|nr:LAGLIDADG family homing endonuclease [Burkholderiales bacterium]